MRKMKEPLEVYSSEELDQYTKKQLERMKRNKEIEESFKELRDKYPEASLERLFSTIARTKKYAITTAAIRFVCKQRGLC